MVLNLPKRPQGKMGKLWSSVELKKSTYIPPELKKSFHLLFSSIYSLVWRQQFIFFGTYDYYNSIFGRPSLCIDHSLHSARHGLVQLREVFGSDLVPNPLNDDASKGVFSVFSNDKNKNYDTVRSVWEFAKNQEQPQVCSLIRLEVTLF